MASAQDKVLKGDYEGILCYDNGFHGIIQNFQKGVCIHLTKENVERYEVLDVKEQTWPLWLVTKRKGIYNNCD